MASCCGGAHRVMYKNVNGKTVRVEVEEENMPKVPVEYTGVKVGGFTIYGTATKTSYRFSMFNRILPVYEEDLPDFMARPNFRRLGMRAPEQTAAPRRGLPPNIDKPIVAPRSQSEVAMNTQRVGARSPAEIAALEASAATAAPAAALRRGRPPKGAAEDRAASPVGPRMRPARNTMSTTKVDPKMFGL